MSYTMPEKLNERVAVLESKIDRMDIKITTLALEIEDLVAALNQSKGVVTFIKLTGMIGGVMTLITGAVVALVTWVKHQL